MPLKDAVKFCKMSKDLLTNNCQCSVMKLQCQRLCDTPKTLFGFLTQCYIIINNETLWRQNQQHSKLRSMLMN